MKLLRYFFVGGAAAVVDIGLFVLLARLAGFPWFPVALFSFTIATLVNYVLSVRHVFVSGVRFSRRHELLLIYMVSAIGLGINQAVLWVGIEAVGLDLLVAKLCATGTVFFWNYAARRHFIFSERCSSDDATDDAALPGVPRCPVRDG